MQAMLGVRFLSKDHKISLVLDEEEITQKPRLQFTVTIREGFPQDTEITAPFFGGKLLALSHYAGTGLELSNTELIIRLLGFDFSAEIYNNKLIMNIIF
jgi:hypothetical protein